MTSKILVVEDEAVTARLVSAALEKQGYKVLNAADGLEGLRIAQSSGPDLLVLDVILPGINGFELLKRLRDDPATRDLPAIMLTAFPVADGESTVMRLGVHHYLDKPLDAELLTSAVRITLREQEARRERDLVSTEVEIPEPAPQRPAPVGLPHLTTPQPSHRPDRGKADSTIKTGIYMLDEELGGGIPAGTLTLIEGTSASGKSVLCQHLAYGALQGGHSVAYFSSEETREGLVSQMASIGLNVTEHVLRRQFGVSPMEDPFHDDIPEELLADLSRQMAGAARRYDVIVVDSVTNLAVYSQERAVIGFVHSCKSMTKEGQTVFLSAHSSSLEEKTLVRLRALLDAHIGLDPRKIGPKLVKALEIYKVNNAEVKTGNSLPFEVHEGVGLRPIPIAQVTV